MQWERMIKQGHCFNLPCANTRTINREHMESSFPPLDYTFEPYKGVTRKKEDEILKLHGKLMLKSDARVIYIEVRVAHYLAIS